MSTVLNQLHALMAKANTMGSEIANVGVLYRAIYAAYDRIGHQDNEFLMNDYDVLALCEHFGVDGAAMSDSLESDQVLAGVNMVTLRDQYEEMAATLEAAGRRPEASVMKWSIGKIMYDVTSCMLELRQLGQSFGRMTDVGVIAYMAVLMGHERRHSEQSAEFLALGREAAATAMFTPGATQTIEACVAYNSIPSEEDANLAGIALAKEVLGIA